MDYSSVPFPHDKISPTFCTIFVNFVLQIYKWFMSSPWGDLGLCASWLFMVPAKSFFLSWHFSAISGSGVPEWVEFVAVWLPTSNGFLNCVFYFWINRSFRRKFHCVLQRLCFGLCPNTKPLHDSVMATLNNNTVQERSSSVSSTCTLLTAAVETYIWQPGTKLGI